MVIRRVLLPLTILAFAGCGGKLASELTLKMTIDDAGKTVVLDNWALDTEFLATDDISSGENGERSSPEWFSKKTVDGKDYRVDFWMSSGPLNNNGTGAWKAHMTSSPLGPDLYDGSNVQITVERIRGSGNAQSPLVFEGTVSQTEGNPKLEGKFKMYTRWGTLAAVNGSDPNRWTKAETGTYGALQDECPAAVTAAFIDGVAWSYDVATLKVGSANPLSCSKNDFGYACFGTKEGISAAGCTWTVDAIGDPTDKLMVFGKANAGCARTDGTASLYCRTGFY